MPSRLLETFVHDEHHLRALEAAICQVLESAAATSC